MEKLYTDLKGDLVDLEPLNPTHIEEMKKVCGDPNIWTWYTEDLTEPESMARWMTARFNESQTGIKLSYAVKLITDEKIIGATSFGNIMWEDDTLEIGWTWLGMDYIGKGINKHMKFLMLQHGFENMGAKRIELRTDELNVRSRKAMEKIGAKYDGTLRGHRYTQNGRRRDTVVYSILVDEWNDLRNSIFKEL